MFLLSPEADLDPGRFANSISPEITTWTANTEG